MGDVADATVTAAALAGVEAVCPQAAKVGLGSGSRTSRTTCAATTLGRAVLLSGRADAENERESFALEACAEDGALKWGRGVEEQGRGVAEHLELTSAAQLAECVEHPAHGGGVCEQGF